MGKGITQRPAAVVVLSCQGTFANRVMQVIVASVAALPGDQTRRGRAAREKLASTKAGV
jgi:hypothetical protein